MGYYDGDCLLDAEAITAWFRRRFADGVLPSALERRAFDWRRVGYAPLASVDAYLIRFGWHPVEIPEGVWLSSKESACPDCGTPVGLHRHGALHSRYCRTCREARRQHGRVRV